MGIWENTILWNQSCLGDIKISGNCCIVAFGADWDGCRWIDIHSISNIDCSGNCCVNFVKNIILEQICKTKL